MSTLKPNRVAGEAGAAYRTLNVRFLDTWHVGSGRGKGQHLDAVVDRDVNGLPYVSGRMLKGLLRDACEMLAAWRTPGPSGVPLAGPAQVVGLFGGLIPRAARGGGAKEPTRQVAAPGLLMVSDARLPPAEQAALIADPRLRQALFMENFQTALLAERGVARKGSLRGIELCVPVTLQAELALQTMEAAAAHKAWALLEAALPLVLALGAMKTRGHGRVELTFAGAPADRGT